MVLVAYEHGAGRLITSGNTFLRGVGMGGLAQIRSLLFGLSVVLMTAACDWLDAGQKGGSRPSKWASRWLAVLHQPRLWSLLGLCVSWAPILCLSRSLLQQKMQVAIEWAV